VFWLAYLCLALLSSGCWSNKQDAAKLEEVKATWAQLPIYPGMQEIGNTTTSGVGKAMISKRYRFDGRYDDVKDFYVQRLSQTGWTVVSDRQLKDARGGSGHLIEFHKGDLSLGIESAGEGANDDWQYAIGVSWSRWVTRKN